MNDETFPPGSNPFDETLFQADGGDLPPVESQLAAVEAQLGITAGQLAEQKDKLLRLHAEFDNFKKRSVRERQEAESKGMSGRDQMHIARSA